MKPGHFQNPDVMPSNHDSKNHEKPTVLAGAYVRQSTVDGQNSKSVDEQLDYIKYQLERGAIRSELYPNAKIKLCDEFVFVDHGLTGRIERGREAFHEFRESLTQKKFDIALVYDLSRLSREVSSLTNLKSLAVMHDVEVISTSEMLSSHSGIADESFVMRGLMNQMYSKAISRQTRRALQLRASTGMSTGVCPYGYLSVPKDPSKIRADNDPANKVICIDEEKAKIVRRIFDLYAHTDIGIDGIAKILNTEGTPSAKGRNWSSHAIHNMLNRRKYVGDWIYGRTEIVRDPDQDKLISKRRQEKDWIRYKDENLRIISQELWDKVQVRFQRIKEEKANAPNKSVSKWGTNRGQANHFFTGTLCCGECGGNFIVVSGKLGGYMGCHNAHRKKTCLNTKTEKLHTIQLWLTLSIKDWLESPEIIRYMCSQYSLKMRNAESKKPHREKDLKKELQKVLGVIQNFVRFLAEGNASDAVMEGLKQNEERKKEIETELSTFTPSVEEKPFEVTPDLIRAMLVNLDEILKLDVKRVNAFFKRLFPERIRMIKKQNGRSFVYEAAIIADLGRLVRSENSAPVQCVPTGIRTPVTSVKGRCPGPLDDGDLKKDVACESPGSRTQDTCLKRAVLYRLS